MNMQTITINKEIQSHIPPLRDEEKEQLEANIITDGCRDPLVIWEEQNVLLDGHNRIEICQRLGIDYETVIKSLPSMDAAIEWVEQNQLGTRNLKPDIFKLYLGREYNRRKGRQGGDHGNQYSVAKGQDVPLPSTSEVIAEEHGVSDRTVKRAGAAAAAIDEALVPEIEEAVIAGDVSMSVATKAAELPEEEQEEIAEEIQQGAEPTEVIKAHVANNSGNNEWYTPKQYIDSALNVLKGIDLDPASSEIANRIVGAKTYYTEEDNGLEKEWNGKVWMNPPYASKLIKKFTLKLIESIESGSVSEAIILVNNATETVWFQSIAVHASAVCFPAKRVKFLDPDGKPRGAPLQGQSVLYIGKNKAEFCGSFSKYGFIMEVSD